MQSRRTFLVSASACAISPLALGVSPLASHQGSPDVPSRSQASDPVLALIETELTRIDNELRRGSRSPATVRALESTLRFQAVHYKDKGYDDLIRKGLKHRTGEIGRHQLVLEMLTAGKQAKEARDAEIRRRFPLYATPDLPILPLPTYDELYAAVQNIENEGLSPRFILQADALRAASEKMEQGQVRQVGVRLVGTHAGEAASWWCDWMAKGLAIDEALLTMWCGLAYFLGPIAEATCAVYAIEVGAEALVYEIVC